MIDKSSEITKAAGQVYGRVRVQIRGSSLEPSQGPSPCIIGKMIDMNSKIGNQVWWQVRDQVSEQVWDQAEGQVSEQVWDQVSGQVWDQVYVQVYGQVKLQSRR